MEEEISVPFREDAFNFLICRLKIKVFFAETNEGGGGWDIRPLGGKNSNLTEKVFQRQSKSFQRCSDGRLDFCDNDNLFAHDWVAERPEVPLNQPHCSVWFRTMVKYQSGSAL